MVNPLLLVVLNTISIEQTTATYKTIMILTQLLGYCTSQLNLALRLTINDTILHIHYDFVSNFRPCAARFIYFLFTLKITSVKRYRT